MCCKGTKQPKDASERVELARIASLKGLYASAATLCGQVIEAEPKAAEPGNSPIRYRAAVCAVLAGTGQDRAKPALDEKQMTQWRKRALDWLNADLGFWTRQVEQSTPEGRRTIRRTLEQWKTDPGLAGVRDEVALRELAEDEQKAWRRFWGEVEKVLKRTTS